MSVIDVLLIGHGAMAGEVLRRLRQDDGARIAAVLIRPQSADRVRSALPSEIVVVTSVSELQAQPDLAVECAGHQAVAEHGEATLRRGIDLVVSSVGALAERALYQRLAQAAGAGKAKLMLPAGAVAGIDALGAARVAGLTRVRYTSRKPPRSWKNTPAENITDLDRVTSPVTLFTGPADEAARLYPQNANVAATIALAGAGFDRTEVTLVADPSATGNIHRIEAAGEFGEFDIEMRGKPLATNPKTSMLAALSVVRAIRNRPASIVI
jgi:aspartate dehydrogenase